MNPVALIVVPAALLALHAASMAADEEPYDPARLEKEVVVRAANDPMDIDVRPDGTIWFIEREGAIKRFDPAMGSVAEIGTLNVLAKADTGLLGLALQPDFETSGHLWVYYCPLKKKDTMRLARLTFSAGFLDPASEKVALEIPNEGDNPAHCGGGLTFDADGLLLLGTGDNTRPQDVPSTHPVVAELDARRSAANSQDLRGKILRLRPNADGSVEPAPGNLFTDPAQGRLEIYAMGCRNPFRIHADPLTKAIVWGDVGGNIDPRLGLGPEGYDELDVTRQPGFFGWPFCSGPNAPWRPFDPATRRPGGDFFDPAHPINDSPHSNGLKNLPAARPAALWYPTSPSAEWPQLGSGGRSITGGPVYRFDAKSPSPIKLPAQFDGRIVFAEWMRNWLMTAPLPADGARVESLQPLAAHLAFRKPADLQIGPDGALYLAEMGDRWTGNTDGQITRLVYRRGNRPPRAEASADVLAGAVPLKVSFDASASTDPDAGDALDYRWSFGPDKSATGVKTEFTFTEAGRYNVELTARDRAGRTDVARLVVQAGNAPPVVRFTVPADGSFFELGREVAWKVEATDAEDGVLDADHLLVQVERRDRVTRGDEARLFPGLALMRSGTCFACHSATDKSAGPPYIEVARRYISDAKARERLAQKIVSGGAGAWSEVPMPPHPQLSLDQTRQMVDWILSLALRRTSPQPRGLSGTAKLDPPSREWGQISNGVMTITATATDHGAEGSLPLRAEAEVVLRTRRQQACFFDRAEKASVQHNLDSGLVARVAAGGWIAFDRIRIDQVGEISLRAWPGGVAPEAIEWHALRPDGPVLAKAPIAAPDAPNQPVNATVTPAPECGDKPVTVVLVVKGPAEATLDIGTIDFRAPR